MLLVFWPFLLQDRNISFSVRLLPFLLPQLLLLFAFSVRPTGKPRLSGILYKVFPLLLLSPPPHFDIVVKLDSVGYSPVRMQNILQDIFHINQGKLLSAGCEYTSHKQ